MNNFEFIVPTRYLFGKNQIQSLPEEVKRYGTRVLLVYGGESIKKIGLYEEVTQILQNAEIKVFELEGVQPNPRVDLIRQGIEICKAEGIELVLAVGGGSVIDCAKAIGMGTKYEGDVWDFFEGKASISDALSVGVILTMPASGSEMNGNCVISNPELKEKRPTGSRLLMPKFSIVDPSYMCSLSAFQTACCVVDIMIHVMEMNFVLQDDTPLQNRFSEAILKTVIENAQIAINQPDNYQARANIAMCGTWAFHVNYGKTEDWTTHILEHEVSAIYDIPHASGLSILWPAWAEYVLEEGMDIFVRYSKNVWEIDCTDKTPKEIALQGIQKTREFFSLIGMPITFEEVNIDSTNFDIMAKKASRYGLLGIVKKLNTEDIVEVFKKCLK